MNRSRLINLYNGTSTIDESTGEIETYERWLERQLIAREHRLKTYREQEINPARFKERRTRLNLSMQDVTDVTVISKATLSRIENGNQAYFNTVMILHWFYADKENATK